MAKHIVVIPGDGIGEEITESAVKVLQKIDEVFGIGLTFEYKILYRNFYFNFIY